MERLRSWEGFHVTRNFSAAFSLPWIRAECRFGMSFRLFSLVSRAQRGGVLHLTRSRPADGRDGGHIDCG